MSKDPERDVKRYYCTQNRELSWLRFNLRVLEEAADETVPLLERLKFISIFTSNLDEFFMVRVGSLFDLSLVSPEEIDNKTGMTPREQLVEIYRTVPELMERRDRLYRTVTDQLRGRGAADLDSGELTAEERKYVNRYFKTQVLPVLSPQIVDSHHPFPHLANKALYVAAQLRFSKGETSLGLIPVPESLPRFLTMPGQPGRFMRMEQVILQWAGTLFVNCKMDSACVVCVTRNADISFDEEKFEDSSDDFRSRMSLLLKKRARLSAVRLEIQGRAGREFVRQLTGRIGLTEQQVFFCQAPLDMKYVYALEKALPAELVREASFPPYTPRWPEDLDREKSIIRQIQRRDKLLFFPFDSVEPFLQLLSEAAERPDVVSIKITFYRLASSSKIARTLCRAAENGKDVTVLMELRARFDEANNISWSRLLEEAGCRVLYGVEGFKCHSKICLITMRDRDKLRYITQIGTGNYNEKTSAMYTDLSLMTASDEIGRDGTAFFQNLMVDNLEGEYASLLVSPGGIKRSVLAYMDDEIARGRDGYICVKINSLTEREVIDKLVEASRAGVQVEMIVRGICCLRPGIMGYTENIHVTSIVGRYLEHARIYCFGRGERSRIYIASADWMTRNLDRRVEIACPVTDPELKAQLTWILNTQLSDNVKASSMLPGGAYSRKRDGLPPVNSQEVFMGTSIHQSAPAEEERPAPSLPGRLLRLARAPLGLLRKGRG